MSRSCPSCGQSAEGRFCSHCGTSLDAPAACAACSAELLPGARFCNACGAPVAGAPTSEPAAAPAAAAAAPSPSPLPWIVAGAAVLVLAAVLLVPRLREGDAAVPAANAPFAQGVAGSGAAGAPGGAVDLSSMTPREAADRLYDRIMRAVSAGDTAEARQFLPMALGAYARVDPLDTDARYHLGALHLIAGDAAAARAEADTILAADDTHLFGLFIAAEAEALRGDREAALGFYRRFLDAFPIESQRILPEYQAHEPALPGMRAQAEAAVQGAG